MKFLKSLLMGTGGVVLAGLVLALLAPKAAHAVVATAVQVVNTSANPAITEDASRQASQIVTISCTLTTERFPPACASFLPNGQLGGTPGPHGGYVVPANQYFVLKSMDTSFSSAPLSITIMLFNPQNVSFSIEGVSVPGNSQMSFSSGIVAGPGMEIVPFEGLPEVNIVTLHGYLTSN
jgi:hypothetical protein